MSARTGTPKILIVDDDPDQLAGQTAGMESHGCKVTRAMGIREGIDALAGFLPHIIVADLMMGCVDAGVVFCAKARAMPGLGQVPIITQTAAPEKNGFAMDASDLTGRKWLQADEVLEKPVPLATLLERIAHHLEQAGTREG